MNSEFDNEMSIIVGHRPNNNQCVPTDSQGEMMLGLVGPHRAITFICHGASMVSRVSHLRVKVGPVPSLSKSLACSQSSVEMANNQRYALQPVRPNTFDKTPLRDSGEVFTAYRNLPVHVRGDQPGTNYFNPKMCLHY